MSLRSDCRAVLAPFSEIAVRTFNFSNKLLTRWDEVYFYLETLEAKVVMNFKL